MHNEREKEAKRSNLLMTVELGPNGAFVPKVNWRVPTMPSYANPISHRGVAYWVNNAGIVTAFDTKSGKQFFAERIQQTCWAAPFGFGDRVYFFGKEGLTTVLKAGPEFRILAENGLWDAPASTGKPGGDEHGGHGKKPKHLGISKPNHRRPRKTLTENLPESPARMETGQVPVARCLPIRSNTELLS